MSNHTPAWNIFHGVDEVEYPYFNNHTVIVTNGEERIATLIDNESERRIDLNEVLSRGHLIAAAPDLLEALEWMLKVMAFEDMNQGYCKNRDQYRQQAKAAIYKARGEAV